MPESVCVCAWEHLCEWARSGIRGCNVLIRISHTGTARNNANSGHVAWEATKWIVQHYENIYYTQTDTLPTRCPPIGVYQVVGVRADVYSICWSALPANRFNCFSLLLIKFSNYPIIRIFAVFVISEWNSVIIVNVWIWKLRNAVRFALNFGAH